MSGSERYASYYLEAYGPALSGIAAFVVLLTAQPYLLPLMAADKLSISNVFSAVFGWASIQTGCVFAIYGFVAGKTDGFIVEIRKTRSMARYNTFIRRAIWSGFILTFTSMPLISWKFSLSADDNLTYAILSAWFSIFIWAFFAFARVAYIFGLLVRADEKVGN
ncbi:MULTISPECIES: hypothetical protein [Rhodopseudomonas]|uniref:hypothetical protein n=1 Tax=Rhodopseudomonas TaxID=1073 RepID=UPI0011C06349|nr:MULTISPECIES: hypothetical protein [Rhodopseudomonas]